MSYGSLQYRKKLRILGPKKFVVIYFLDFKIDDSATVRYPSDPT